MASYLSYFTSSQPQQPAQGGAPTSTWSSAFAQRISNLRNALTKGSEEDDPDNEDCSHVSNVLRAYYIEKGRPFPDWLPPDPKKPPPVMQQPAQAGQYSNFGGYAQASYGHQPTHNRGSSGSRGGLSDLWDSSPASPPQSTTQSLRAPRPTPQSLRSHDSQNSTGSQPLSPQSLTASARPLPSQRAGSYQNVQTANVPTLGSKDRLRARLQGTGNGRSSPASSSGGSGSFSGQGSGGGGGNRGPPFISATEPWSSGADEYGFGSYTNVSSTGSYGSSQQARPRPGPPR